MGQIRRDGLWNVLENEPGGKTVVVHGVHIESVVNDSKLVYHDLKLGESPGRHKGWPRHHGHQSDDRGHDRDFQKCEARGT